MKHDKGGKGKGGKRSLLEVFIGKRVVYQLLKGTIIIGTFVGSEGDYYFVTDAVIMGANRKYKTPACAIQKRQIQHFHLEGELLPLDENEKKQYALYL